MNILILGVTGLIGMEISNELSVDYEVYGTYDKSTVDSSNSNLFQWNISDSDKLQKILNITKPEVVISCLTGDYNIQLRRHEEIAEYLNRIDGKMVFISSGNVFDGKPFEIHDEKDEPYAISPYGQFKINCENMLLEKLGDKVLITRLPHIFTRDRAIDGFKTSYEAGLLKVISNLVISCNTPKQVGKQISYLLTNQTKGIIHLTSTDTIVWEDFLITIGQELRFYKYKLIDSPYTAESYCIELGCNDINKFNWKQSNLFNLALHSIRTDLDEEDKLNCEQVISSLKL